MSNMKPTQVTRDEWNDALRSAYNDAQDNLFTYRQLVTGRSLYMYAVPTHTDIKTVLIFKDTYDSDGRPWRIQHVSEIRGDEPEIVLGDEWLGYFKTRTEAAHAVHEVAIDIDTNAYEYAVDAGMLGRWAYVLTERDRDGIPAKDGYYLYVYPASPNNQGLHRRLEFPQNTRIAINADRDNIIGVTVTPDTLLDWTKIDGFGLVDTFTGSNLMNVPFVILKALRAEDGWTRLNQ